MNPILLGVALATLLASCASPAPEPAAPAAPLRERLENQNRAALAAFEQGRFEQAANLYEQALDTASAMDDSSAIVDAHYNRAVSLMLAENYPDARISVRRAEDELALTGRNSPPELTLLAATLAYRTGEPDRAWALTASLVGPDTFGNGQVRERAWFLRGLLAKQRGDGMGLEEAIEALRGSGDPDTVPDRLELEGYRAAAAGDEGAAVDALDEASRYRNEIGDYRGMSRSLVAAAEALEATGRQREAADRYLRAGRSAASRGSLAAASRWLERAAELGDQAGATSIADEARTQLQQIDEKS